MQLPDGAGPLALGTLLAMAALSVVLSPLVSEAPTQPPQAPEPDVATGGEGTSVQALREIEFDKATGKLSDKDYESLRATYTQSALAEMRAAEGALGASTATVEGDERVERAIHRATTRSGGCPVCGPRPEPDAEYCSSCGRYLAESCGSCGEPVELVGARYCVRCGDPLVST